LNSVGFGQEIADFYLAGEVISRSILPQGSTWLDLCGRFALNQVMSNSENTPLSLSFITALRLDRRRLRLEALVGRWGHVLLQYQNARLITALLFFLSLLPAAMRSDARLELSFPVPFLCGFIFLVWRTRHLAKHVQNLSRLRDFTDRQKNRCRGQISGRSWQAAEATALKYPLIRDLGLTGAHSLWTLLDETLSEGGRRRLLQWMSVEPLAPAELQRRQEKIKSLRSQTWFYTRLGIAANSNEFNLSTLQIQDFLKRPFVEPKFSKLLIANVGLWLLTLAIGIFSLATGAHISPFIFLVFPILSLSSLSSAGSAFLSGVGLSHHLAALSPTFSAIEKRSFASASLRELCPRIHQDSPSKSARRLDFVLGLVGTQTNPILHLFLNVLTPWTMVSVYFLERIRRKMVDDFPPCIQELSELEVFGSLLIFDKYQTRTYPELGDKTVLHCRQIFHPLIDRSKAVANDFSFPEPQSLGLLTGSNMSGKSTFLRTIGMNQVLANMGAPVFAASLTTRPLKIETCIEVTDSLRDGYSYFYAEVRKLKEILQTAATKVPVLFLIDEIFRGTNNRERQIGSRAVIKTLAHEATALGFISTHDLELTTLETTNPSLLNLHFREDIDDQDQMIFSYLLRQGPCPTTNALRIMAAEGIRIEE
jgi:hypothetical protein